MIETIEALSPDELMDLIPNKLISGKRYSLQSVHHAVQKLTHQDIQAFILHIKAKKHLSDHEVVSPQQMKTLAFPRLLQQWIDEELISNKGDN